MKDFISRNLIFISVTLVTLVVIIGGVFLFSKGGGSSTSTKTVPDTLLIPTDPYITGGISNGKFLPQSKDAKVTIVEFGDYQCPACSAYSPLVDKILTEFSGKVNLTFRNFPLPQHTNATITSYAAEAAGLQGKFWDMHVKLYDSQEEWSDSSVAKDIVIRYATEMALDVNKFKADIDSSKVKERVTKDIADANLIGINSTPTFFINGQKIDNPRDYEEFKKIVSDAINKSPIVQDEKEEAFHAHFDLKIYTDGVPVDLSLAKYQSTEGKELHEFVHLHDGNGKAVHLHKDQISLKTFVDSIKINFLPDTALKTLKVYVNGTIVPEGLSYMPKDLDRILISYGPITDKNIETQIKSVTDVACIYSEKCPERGKAPTEACVGGVGTECKTP